MRYLTALLPPKVALTIRPKPPTNFCFFPIKLEVEFWSHARASVTSLNGIYAGPPEAVGRVNRLISSWPSDDTLPAEGFDEVKKVYKKLVSGLQELEMNAEREIKYDNTIVLSS